MHVHPRTRIHAWDNLRDTVTELGLAYVCANVSDEERYLRDSIETLYNSRHLSISDVIAMTNLIEAVARVKDAQNQ